MLLARREARLIVLSRSSLFGRTKVRALWFRLILAWTESRRRRVSNFHDCALEGVLVHYGQVEQA